MLLLYTVVVHLHFWQNVFMWTSTRYLSKSKTYNKHIVNSRIKFTFDEYELYAVFIVGKLLVKVLSRVSAALRPVVGGGRRRGGGKLLVPVTRHLQRD